MVPTAFNAALFSSLKGVAVGTFVFLTICESREVGVKNIIRYTLHSCDNCRLDAGVYNDGLLAALKDMVFFAVALFKLDLCCISLSVSRFLHKVCRFLY